VSEPADEPEPEAEEDEGAPDVGAEPEGDGEDGSASDSLDFMSGEWLFLSTQLTTEMLDSVCASEISRAKKHAFNLGLLAL